MLQRHITRTGGHGSLGLLPPTTVLQLGEFTSQPQAFHICSDDLP